MKKLALILLLLMASVPAWAVSCTGSVCTFVSGDSQTTMNTYIHNASYLTFIWPPNTTYDISSSTGLDFRCDLGQTYEGNGGVPMSTPSSTNEPTTIFVAGFHGAQLINIGGGSGGPYVSPNFTSPGQGCTIEWMEFQQQGIYVYPAASGILIDQVWIDGIPYQTMGPNYGQFNSMSLYADGNSTCNGGPGGCSNTPAGWAYSTVEDSVFEDSCTDVQNTNTGGDGYGVCGSVGWHGSDSHITIKNNWWLNGYEGIKAISANPFGSSYQHSTDLTVNNNDFGDMHRIAIELQSDVTSGRVVYGNSYHDDYNPDGNTMAISDAGSAPAAGAANPSEIHHDNTLVANVAGNPSCGFTGGYCSPEYAEETWGNGPSVHNDLVQGLWNHGIVAGSLQQSTGVSCTSTYFPSGGYPCPSNAPNFSYNIVQGPNMSGSGTSSSPAVGCEDGPYNWPTACGQSGTLITGSPYGNVGNSFFSTVSAQVSTASTISPAAGPYSYPITVTPGNSASNQASWCTTDGSTPVPGSGTAVRYDAMDGAILTLTGPATVKCVGMWGEGGNPATWPSGYGWIPSSVVTVVYTNAGGGSTGFALQGPKQFQGVIVQ